jgi:hypothetical protein
MRLDGKPNREERQHERTCAKKKVYVTPWDAVKAAAVYSMNGFKWQSPYECSVCRGIHLTSRGEK